MTISSTLITWRERALAYLGLFLIGLIGWLCDREVGVRMKRLLPAGQRHPATTPTTLE